MFDIWTFPATAVVHFSISLMLSGHARLGRNMDCDICIRGGNFNTSNVDKIASSNA